MIYYFVDQQAHMPKKESENSELLREAVAHHQAHDLPRAEALYRKVLHADPNNVTSLNGLGLIALRFNHLEFAKKSLSRSLEIAPSISETHRYLGNVFSSMQDHQQALDCYQMALQLDPDDLRTAQLIAKTDKALRIEQDPDYALIKTAPWNDSDWVWEETSGNSTIFVLFSGLGVGRKPPTFIFSKFLSAYPMVDRLFLRDLEKKWFLGGLGKISRNVEETANFIQEKLRGYKRSVFIGCSAGGLAAILYGEILKPNKVLAFAPQTVLSDAKEKEYKDFRWFGHMSKLRKEIANKAYLDLKYMNPYLANIDVHYSLGCEVDRLHAERISGKNLNLFPHEGSDGHLVALYLRDSGKLRGIIESELVTIDVS